jgi:serine/threonine protein kinase
MELPSWYNTRLHTPIDRGVQRTTKGEPLGEGAFGKVIKAVDLDSGYPIAVKKIVLSKIKLAPSDLESSLRWEVKTLFSLSHICMFLVI